MASSLSILLTRVQPLWPPSFSQTSQSFYRRAFAHSLLSFKWVSWLLWLWISGHRHSLNSGANTRRGIKHWFCGSDVDLFLTLNLAQYDTFMLQRGDWSPENRWDIIKAILIPEDGSRLGTHVCAPPCPDCNLPGYSVHGIPQARILEWPAFPAPGDLSTQGSNLNTAALAGRFFTTSATWKPHFIFPWGRGKVVQEVDLRGRECNLNIWHTT